MKIQIDIPETSPLGQWKKFLLLALPVILILVAILVWTGPILQTLSPFAIAFVLAYLLNPLVDWLVGKSRTRVRMNRFVAILLVFGVIIGGVMTAIAYIIPNILRESTRFASETRVIYLPAIKREIQPRLESWFSTRNMVDNPSFDLIEEGNLIGWNTLSSEMKTDSLIDETGLLLSSSSISTGTHPCGLEQNIADLPGDETYTLLIRTGRLYPDNEQWTVSLESFPIQTGTNTIEPVQGLKKIFPLKSRQTHREEIHLPAGNHSGQITLLAPAGIAEASLELLSVELLKQPPLPIFQARFWDTLWNRYSYLLDWSAVWKMTLYGIRGAGAVAGGAGGVWSWLTTQVGGIISILVYFTLLVVILFYMLLDFAAFKADLLNLFPESFRIPTLRVAREIDRQLGGFIRGQMIVCACVGGLVTFFMLILSVPFALVIGLAAGMFNFIPYLGPAMGIIPALSLTLLEFFDPDQTANWVLIKLGLVAGSFMLVQATDGFLISPKVMSSTVDVSPLVVMGVLMLGGAIGGVTGMVLAIPFYCIFRVLIGEYHQQLRPRPPDPSI